MTATMVVEAAMCLAFPPEGLQKNTSSQGGVLTPAMAFQHTLTERLRQKGFAFYIAESSAI